MWASADGSVKNNLPLLRERVEIVLVRVTVRLKALTKAGERTPGR